MPDANELSQDNFGAVQIVEPGGGGLNGDALGATLGAELEDDAEIEALEEEDDDAAEADVTASGWTIAREPLRGIGAVPAASTAVRVAS